MPERCSPLWPIRHAAKYWPRSPRWAGTATATELALELPITRQAITKHLTVLAEAGLVTSVRHGREARYRVVAGSLRPAADWIAHTEASWGRRVDRLQRHLADR